MRPVCIYVFVGGGRWESHADARKHKSRQGPVSQSVASGEMLQRRRCGESESFERTSGMFLNERDEAEGASKLTRPRSAAGAAAAAYGDKKNEVKKKG